MADVPEFDVFYRAVNGREPFPWQRRLAAVVEDVGWPDEIGIPTGLGKTACLDIAVWSLARQAVRPPGERSAPTRMWYVVNRRLLVDGALDHGRRIAALLAEASSFDDADSNSGRATALAAVADALQSMRGGAGARPLHVTRLRGGAELGARAPDPAQPTLVFATVPMFASRWMFRGYGTSTSMRPVDAALAGIDSLVLLDESHLAQPLLHLGGPLAECDIGDPAGVVPQARSRPTIVGLTATGDQGGAFTLDADDSAHPIVRRRLEARKPVRLASTTERRLPAAIVAELTRVLRRREPCTAVVFANSPRLARDVFSRLSGSGREAGTSGLGADVELLTGRVRDREGDRTRARLLDPSGGAPSARSNRTSRARHLVVVATQTLEVGADLDFDVLVTEACGARALVQRLGRLNRLGDTDDAEGVMVFAEDAKSYGVYGQEPRQVWSRLAEAADRDVVELSPRVAASVIGPPADEPDRVGEILPAHLWEWAKTAMPPEGEAPPELFFDGFGDEGARLSVVWRTDLPDDGGVVLPAVTAAESVEVPLWEAGEALATMGDGTVSRLRADRVTIERNVAVDRLRPGDQVVVEASSGGYDEYGWAPTCRESVVDPSLLRPPGVPLTTDCLRAVAAEGDDLDAAVELARVLSAPPEPDEEIDRQALAGELRDRLISAGRHPAWLPNEWDGFAVGLRAEVDHPVGGVARLVVRPRPGPRQMIELRSDAFDELSFTATSAELTEHLGTVGDLAGRIGAHIGVPRPLVDALVAAGRFHDLGKQDVRFQRWLDPTMSAARPLAKSSRPWHQWRRDRLAAGWPERGRHEELSRRLVTEWLVGREVVWDVDLVLHLIVAHHGYGRPLVAPVRDNAPVPLSAAVEEVHVTVSGDLADADWDQPARFRRCCERYGYWGLALLEAIVRQADHQASAVAVA